MELRDKVVVITGSGGGIGEACARRFATEGAKVVVTDINPEGVKRVSDSIGTVGLAGDITAEDTVRAVAELARATYGEIDIWFSNAGYAGPRRAGDIADDGLWDLSWRLHVMSHVYAARQVLPSMLERGDGYLLQTASVVALTTHPDKAAYAVTKHAALAFSEWLAMTYRPKGIKVSCFCPGPMLTPMLMSDGIPADHPALQNVATPEEVAERLVGAIETEQFLIVDSPMGLDSLTGKAADYERWVNDMTVLINS
ncbi:SDR family NAD(P)-dependent oxidoreductase [Mycobacterium nebraskense]|uniref:Short-chain dehydrogenase n=1 Tax=Mycobacterium nebraskense TaxID=244292 RepID=A0A0F5NIQ2_9MYCO|nr:SDR family oxidoreductase [Mycobacterium nebraskense]KKC06951.1 short-chain dehydrogenase [Mycobacterium nebraskense]KLO46701.1 short-chain dehydrogenase [Mycobacterium nebraskense]MBI2694550.1 SDR family oxidoreductase [Mycobacterium nebraskense]MCV7118264.1 SDR family oxidoreductase [Mycobacterium nebraskense]ORW27090.1 short-chain dehydrogenase [Mycobacterium nebraskense]